ncbi:MAG: hypothetical protein QNJ78_16515 [Gammaproteobacteria bacterium]|nr:hypothetical protein [Gammaproteobacteria bacterium]
MPKRKRAARILSVGLGLMLAMMAGMLEARDLPNQHLLNWKINLATPETGVMYDDRPIALGWLEELFTKGQTRLFSLSHTAEQKPVNFGVKGVFDGYVIYISQEFQ